MKRNPKWIMLAVLLITVIALLVFPIGKYFTLPFEAEEVSTVILWSFWGYKEVTESADIAMIVERMNDIRLRGEFDFESYEPREGDYACSVSFFLKDGRTYEYSAMPKPGLTTIFRDADGTYYKAKKVPVEKIYNGFGREIQPGKPFLTE